MSFKKVKVTKKCNVTIEEDKYSVVDLDGKERLVDDKDAYDAFDKAVYWADNLRNFVAKEFEDKYVTSQGIKKGDIIAVSSNMEYNCKLKEFKLIKNSPVDIGYYAGFEISGFSYSDKLPKFRIKLDKSWQRGCEILVGGDTDTGFKPYKFIPLVNDHDTCEFYVPENNKLLHTTVRLATPEEKKEHEEVLKEIKKVLP